MVLSDRQKDELNRAVLDYLLATGYTQVLRSIIACIGLILALMTVCASSILARNAMEEHTILCEFTVYNQAAAALESETGIGAATLDKKQEGLADALFIVSLF